MIVKKIIFCICAALILVSCGEDNSKAPLFKHNVILNMDNIANANTIVPSETAHSGKNICRIDSGQGFGIGYTFSLPDSLIGKTIAIDLDAWLRSGKTENNCEIICSVTQRDSVLFWQGFGAYTVMKTANEWSNLKNTIILPTSITDKPNLLITVAAQNVGKLSYFDVDDLNIKYYEYDND